MSDTESSDERVLRHAWPERLYHWMMAASMLVLLATGFLPVLGFRFAWVDPHWIAGVILTVLVLFHGLRAVTRLSLSTMRIRWREFATAVSATSKEIAGAARGRKRVGKYSVGQKYSITAWQ